jgi:hypothetical protein
VAWHFQVDDPLILAALAAVPAVLYNDGPLQ